MKRFALYLSVSIAVGLLLGVLYRAFATPGDSTRPETFDVSGTYLYPSPDATRDEDCRSTGMPAEGDEVVIEKVERDSISVVARGNLDGGHLDPSDRTFGADRACVYPFTVTDVPSGAMSYGASVRGDPGLWFTEADAGSIVVVWLPPLGG